MVCFDAPRSGTLSATNNTGFGAYFGACFGACFGSGGASIYHFTPHFHTHTHRLPQHGIATTTK